MNAILAIPIGLRLVGLAIIGAWVGSAVNWAIYRFAYSPRLIGPWSATSSTAPARWSDRLPIVGWLGLRRESRWHGDWIRPMLVELFTGFGLAALYWWEVESQELLPAPLHVPMLAQKRHSDRYAGDAATGICRACDSHRVYARARR